MSETFNEWKSRARLEFDGSIVKLVGRPKPITAKEMGILEPVDQFTIRCVVDPYKPTPIDFDVIDAKAVALYKYYHSKRYRYIYEPLEQANKYFKAITAHPRMKLGYFILGDLR